MSDREVEQLLGRMEAWLEAEPFAPEGDFLTAWLAEWPRAVARAERGPGWENLVQKAGQLAQRVAERTGPLMAQRDAILSDLRLQSVGQRALRGYQSGTQRV
nr:hypothetical protein [uncultured Holophaga sp.]